MQGCSQAQPRGKRGQKAYGIWLGSFEQIHACAPWHANGRSIFCHPFGPKIPHHSAPSHHTVLSRQAAPRLCPLASRAPPRHSPRTATSPRSGCTGTARPAFQPAAAPSRGPRRLSPRRLHSRQAEDVQVALSAICNPICAALSHQRSALCMAIVTTRPMQAPYFVGKQQGACCQGTHPVWQMQRQTPGRRAPQHAPAASAPPASATR